MMIRQRPYLSMGGNLPPMAVSPMQTGGAYPAQPAPGMAMGGNLPPMLQPGMQTGGYDGSGINPGGMYTGGVLPPQVQGMHTGGSDPSQPMNFRLARMANPEGFPRRFANRLRGSFP